MATTENPPLNRIHVAGYSANDQNFPILNLVADPRVAGYKVPEDLSACPDKRYPNHVFTGAQPISGDQRVRHVWEILPSPWVPFTRYDDDLGPVQGRRRSVANTGQKASLSSDKKVSYEGREGSAIVSTELEETWSIAVDEDGNSLFPVKVRDFYDPSKGAVEERRQLFVPTGEEEGTLENINGVITQTSYDVYNEYLSIKIVQTYKVNGPQLIGKSTDNDGQLVTVTTQRKGADKYIPPSPTATRTVEVSREDAESLIERIIDTPEIFKANTYSVERPDPIPQKFRVAVPIKSSQEVVAGSATIPTLQQGELTRSEEQKNKFIKRVSFSSRDQNVLPKTLLGKATDNDLQAVTITETLQSGDTSEVPTATKTIESEALGDGNYVVRKTEVPEVFAKTILSKERPDTVPQKFRALIPTSTKQENIAGVVADPVLASGQILKSEEQVNKFVKRLSTTSRDLAKIPQSLTQKTTTNEGLLAQVTETLQSGDTQDQPSSKKSIESEAIGDGTYVVRTTLLPEVFSAKVFRSEKADLTPQKFKAKQLDLTIEENIEGTASSPTLGPNDFLKSEQQVNKFVKRVATTSRNTETNETLNEFVITPEGQLAKRNITLSKAAQTLSPSALIIDGNVEELGDGRTVKTEISVDSVFDGRQEALEKPEVIPPEFRASLQNKTVSEVKVGQSASLTSLSQDQLSKRIQRVTQHKIQETTVTRPSSSYPSLSGQLIDNDLIRVTRTRTVSKGSQTISPSAKTSGQVEALGDGYTLKTEDVKEKIFKGSVFSKEKPDNIPVEFRAEKPASTEEYNEEGTATAITLSDTEISKSEQQINDFVKRIRKTTRDVTNSATLTGEQIDQDGIKVIVTKTLASGSQSIAPSARISGQVEAIGDGKTIKTQLDKSQVFDAKTKTLQQAFQLPQKFVSGKIEEDSSIEEATTATPEAIGQDGKGIVQSTAQRVTAFTVRKTKRTVEGTTSTTEKQINNSGQAVTISSTISSDPSIEIGPRVEIARTQALGGGKYLKEIGTVNSVFDSKQRTFTQSTQIPAKFLDGKTTETSLIEEGTSEQPETVNSDGFGIVQSSSQRVNAFLRRQTKKEQEGVTTITESQFNNAKQKVTVTSSIVDSPELDFSAKTEFAKAEAIGGGKYVKEVGTIDSVFDGKIYSVQKSDVIPEQFKANIPTKTIQEIVEKNEAEEPTLDKEDLEKSEQRLTNFTVRKSSTSRTQDFPILLGQDYDPSVNLIIPFSEKITESGSSLTDENTFVDPLSDDFDLVRKIDTVAIQEKLDSIFLEFPSRSNLSLPPVLKSVNLIWDSYAEDGSYDSEFTGFSSGESWALTGNEDGNAESSAEVSPSFETEIDDVWANNIPTTSYFFFLPYPVDIGDILQKVGAKQWPVFKPKSHLISAVGQKKKITLRADISSHSSGSDSTNSKTKKIGKGSTKEVYNKTVFLKIPPTLHGEIEIRETGDKNKQLKANVNVSLVGDNMLSVVVNDNIVDNVAAQRSPSILDATNPPDIPRSGKYLIDSKVELYQYGYAKVYAEVIDASIFENK